MARRLPEYRITEKIYRNIETPEIHRIDSARKILKKHSDMISEIPINKRKTKRRE